MPHFSKERLAIEWVVVLMVIFSLLIFAFFLIQKDRLSQETPEDYLFSKLTFLYINGTWTDFYFYPDSPNEIYFRKKGLDEKIADVRDNKIYLAGFFLLDGKINPESSFIQRYRSYSGLNISNFLIQLQFIDKASIGDFGEVLSVENRTEILKSWPENSMGFINLTIQELGISTYKNKVSISIPGLNLSQNPKIMFLYLKQQDSYIEVKGSKKVFFIFNLFDKDYANLAKFYPDGSVWLDTRLVQLEDPFIDDYISGEFDLGDFYALSRSYGSLKWETNYYFRDYEKLSGYL